MQQNLITQDLNSPHKIVIEKDGMVCLVPLSLADQVAAISAVPCTPGEIIDFIIEHSTDKQFGDRDIVKEYTDVTNPWRGTEPYPAAFYEAAQKWLTENGFDFTVMRLPEPIVVLPVNTVINNVLRPVDKDLKYYVTFGDEWLYRRYNGKKSDGKPEEEFNLDYLRLLGAIPAGVEVKTNALGVQCARLYLQAMQDYVKQ